MTEAQLQEFHQLLLDTREELRQALELSEAGNAPVSPDNAIGRLTRQDAMQAQQLNLEVRRRNQIRLQQVELALQKMQGGEYGMCNRCEEEISLARLRVRPESQLCIRCAEAR